jgi:hypothetical protein
MRLRKVLRSFSQVISILAGAFRDVHGSVGRTKKIGSRRYPLRPTGNSDAKPERGTFAENFCAKRTHFVDQTGRNRHQEIFTRAHRKENDELVATDAYRPLARASGPPQNGRDLPRYVVSRGMPSPHLRVRERVDVALATPEEMAREAS